MAKITEIAVPFLQYDEQASDPTTPGTDLWRLYTKSDGFYAINDAGSVTGPLGAGGASGGLDFKEFVHLIGQGNINGTTAATWTAIDGTNLPWTGAATLAIGDVVELVLQGQFYHNKGDNTGVIRVDFAVDQPTSADTQVGASSTDAGLVFIKGNTRQPRTIIAYFEATEAGEHKFRPIWNVDATASDAFLSNATSGWDETDIIFSAKKL